MVGCDPLDLDPTAGVSWGRFAAACDGADGGARRQAAPEPPEMAGMAFRSSVWAETWCNRERRRRRTQKGALDGEVVWRRGCSTARADGVAGDGQIQPTHVLDPCSR